MQIEKYRGPITNRGFTTLYNKRDGIDSEGNLEFLKLTLPELDGKRLLNVGIGGGKALEHALELGLDCHGLDIVPLIDTSHLTPERKSVVDVQAKEFERVRSLYPERVKAVDFCTPIIPYSTNEFDIVFSAVALPDYARTEKEASISLLNMIRLAAEKVVFHCGWNPSISENGLVALGSVPSLFTYRMKDFIDRVVAQAGITYKIDPPVNPQTSLTTIISICTNDKDSQALQAIYDEYN